MDNSRLATLLGVAIIPGIIEEFGITDSEQPEFLDRLYRSQTFELLEQPSTGLWHLSAATLADIFRDELEGRQLVFPEEQS
jgi:hypothetical protein